MREMMAAMLKAGGITDQTWYDVRPERKTAKLDRRFYLTSLCPYGCNCSPAHPLDELKPCRPAIAEAGFNYYYDGVNIPIDLNDILTSLSWAKWDRSRGQSRTANWIYSMAWDSLAKLLLSKVNDTLDEAPEISKIAESKAPADERCQKHLVCGKYGIFPIRECPGCRKVANNVTLATAAALDADPKDPEPEPAEAAPEAPEALLGRFVGNHNAVCCSFGEPSLRCSGMREIEWRCRLRQRRKFWPQSKARWKKWACLVFCIIPTKPHITPSKKQSQTYQTLDWLYRNNVQSATYQALVRLFRHELKNAMRKCLPQLPPDCLAARTLYCEDCEVLLPIAFLDQLD